MQLRTKRSKRNNISVTPGLRKLLMPPFQIGFNVVNVEPSLELQEYFSQFPRSGELRTQKLKCHLVRTQSLNVFPFKHGVGQYIAIHATFTARDFFLA